MAWHRGCRHGWATDDGTSGTDGQHGGTINSPLVPTHATEKRLQLPPSTIPAIEPLPSARPAAPLWLRVTGDTPGQGELDGGSAQGSRHRWAWLLTHVFLADLEHCPKCHGPMRWAKVAKTPEAAVRLLAREGLLELTLRPRARNAFGQLRLPFDT